MGLISKRTFRLLPVLGTFLLLFALGSCCMADAVLSKPWLALCGVVSSAGGIMGGYAILFLCGVPLIEIAMIVPFLVLSIGVDDMFVILNVWRQAPFHLPVPERLAWTMREAGVSISVTTLTDAGVFLLGTASVFPAVQTFCLYSSISILAVFAFQITFFPACITLTGKREQQLRHCLTFKKISKKERYKCSCMSCCANPRERKERRKNLTPWPVLFFQGPYKRFLSRAMTQAVAGGSYLIYIALATFCLANRLQQGLQISHLVPYDTDTFRYLQSYEKFFSRYSTAAEVVINEPLEYSDPQIQQQLLRFATKLESSAFARNSDFWLKDFLSILPRNSSLGSRRDFYDFLIEGFLRSQPNYHYVSDINLYQADDDRYFINSSRFYLPLQNMGYKNRSAAMQRLTKVVDSFRALGFPVLIYDVSFPLAEQFDAIVPGTALNVAVAGIGILLVALLFIPCFKSCLAISLAVLSINIGVLGFLSAWNVHLDIISSITILLSIGFSVDFTSHVSYHFHHAPGTKGAEKLGVAMGTVGWPILQSSLSTLVGVVTVIGVEAYIAETFVKTVVLVMLIGTYHGMLILPVLLCVLTDCFNRLKERTEKHYAERTVRDIERGRGRSSDESQTDRKRESRPKLPERPKGRMKTPPNSREERRREKSDEERRERRKRTKRSGAHKQKWKDSGAPRPAPKPKSSKVAVVKPRQQAKELRGKRTYRSFIHGKQQTVRVDTAWIDAWLHGDIACSQKKGKYCAYCDTRENLEDDVVKVKTLSHRSDNFSTWTR